MNDSTEMESAFAYKQFTKAWDLLEDLIAKVQSALRSPEIVDWRIPGLQVELARAYEALSRDEEAEATFAAAAESAKRVDDGPTSEELVQLALGEFYIRRRMFDRALITSQFVRAGGPGADAWLLLYLRVRACAGLGLTREASEAAAAYISASPNQAGAKRQIEAILGHISNKS